MLSYCLLALLSQLAAAFPAEQDPSSQGNLYAPGVIPTEPITVNATFDTYPLQSDASSARALRIGTSNSRLAKAKRQDPDAVLSFPAANGGLALTLNGGNKGQCWNTPIEKYWYFQYGRGPADVRLIDIYNDLKDNLPNGGQNGEKTEISRIQEALFQLAQIFVTGVNTLFDFSVGGFATPTAPPADPSKGYNWFGGFDLGQFSIRTWAYDANPISFSVQQVGAARAERSTLNYKSIAIATFVVVGQIISSFGGWLASLAKNTKDIRTYGFLCWYLISITRGLYNHAVFTITSQIQKGDTTKLPLSTAAEIESGLKALYQGVLGTSNSEWKTVIEMDRIYTDPAGPWCP